MTIGIIGFGRFGAFLAKSLKNISNEKILVSDKLDKSKIAKKIGVSFKNLDEVCQQDLIILCVPISEIDNLLKEIKNKVKKEAIIMDTLSVKEYPSKLMKKYLPIDIEIIASHPMFGPDSGKYGLKNLQMVFWPLRIKKKNYKKVLDIFKKLELKIIQMSPKEHDKESALSLCLVHFIGRTMEKMEIPNVKIKTLGYEKLSEVYKNVKNDSLQLFKDMQTYNKYAKFWRKKFLKSAQEIDNQLKTKI
ncbi:MAG TPA: prephenate dehydrogenase/arogenate dehydrogenase family protein [Candidatus Pacearchaeota archaeon]|nr:prephenate dehydrogenase/arogenate dehydrogenase family protein [Candidatus Paceibacterota bacterium]HOK00686.1 prephenate dehydrogenase/arogenate dehydrogenase family protein [Candidatus Pacearchaeota archaeon]HOL90442.1 prephenate dehydrogenase/arogenate dehydrogenase family protein [Candidatus Pacearchaeota archaeon]HPO68433.1 prephenate dehydrogenase/arogenate dehydrogenase family protein [Candidatus Pacearchaeota archaeon]